jgi:hypothetical protein
MYAGSCAEAASTIQAEDGRNAVTAGGWRRVRRMSTPEGRLFETVASLSGPCATAVSAVPGSRSSYRGNPSRTADTAVANLESQGFRHFHPMAMVQSRFVFL